MKKPSLLVEGVRSQVCPLHLLCRWAWQYLCAGFGVLAWLPPCLVSSPAQVFADYPMTASTRDARGSWPVGQAPSWEGPLRADSSFSVGPPRNTRHEQPPTPLRGATLGTCSEVQPRCVGTARPQPDWDPLGTDHNLRNSQSLKSSDSMASLPQQNT